jgi:hypothetical protein
MKTFLVKLEKEEIDSVKELVKNFKTHSLLSSYEDAVNFGILHQILEQSDEEEKQN